MTRVVPPFVADERATYTALLDYLRATIELKVEGLSDADATRAVLPSKLTTAAGVVKHVRWTEHHWFEVVLAGRDSRAPYTMEDPDADWRVEEGETLAGFLADYRAQCDISREVLAGLALDAEVPFRGDRTVSARWVLAHLVDETARHAGHLDVVRELLDGTVGD
ncbi:DinB family protein [Lentzea sp. BCCO 10_0798]|uniref:DinB family protein n=1 Tax=Lentzea kristufekii TaxID=3095430 RepID=A0ABU4TIP1_9PSEU|nr:DinB family protein [Lentzea sp. BCCO 10_0798]MDX8048115.1 DinB family protein [Lentzea sp. BCCO 10_0798]